ncbi:unnamed protein product [Caenorhabditis sp. 36 PRJEB53466]|nr:unnamed protein product [Caenorhabditis sp. 36 PRJEB53466]
MSGQNDKNACKDALKALEQLLIRDASDSSFNSINTSKYGFYSPRTELRQGRLYYMAEPMFVRVSGKEIKSHADSSDLDHLPYIEISFVKHGKICSLPVFSHSGEWTQFNDAKVCICIRFKHGFLFSQHTIRKLAQTVPRSPLVRHYVNFYRFLTARPTIKENLEMVTQFPDESDVQQKYGVDSRKLSKEDDLVAVEMFLTDLRDLPKLVETLRSEWMHASLWESILAMCEPKQGIPQKEVDAVDVQLMPRRSEFQLQFNTKYGSMTMQIAEKSLCKYVVKTICQLTGESPSEELDKILTEKLNSTWSIPATLTFAFSEFDCELIKVFSPLKPINSSDNSSTIHFDKRHQAWLNPNTSQISLVKKQTEKQKAVVLERGPPVEPTKLHYSREEDKEIQGSLLFDYGEVDSYFVQTTTVGKTKALPRAKPAEPNPLSNMDMMSMDLEGERARLSLESSRQQEMQRMSHLESARMHMKQSIGAAHAVGLASHQPSPSPAPGPMRQHSYTMGFDPPAPYDPNIPASIQFPDPLAFGKGKPRKSRAKKQPGEEGAAPAGRGKGRKGRGAAAVGGAGGRKSTGVTDNPFGMDQMRPPLQRSFSDFPGQINPQHMAQYQQMQMQQFQQSQQLRMHQQQQQMSQQMQSPQHPGIQTPKYPPNTLVPAYADDDSDADDCDPPPPPKPANAQRGSVPPPQQLGNPMVGYPGMPLQSPNHFPLTPSPLSAPPKPFSPEQQHFGMKMRENAYWKEGERLDVKPDLNLLKQQAAAAAASSAPASSFTAPHALSEPSTSSAPDPLKPAPTPKKKLGLEAAISKIRGQQEQALAQQKLQQQQSQESVGETPQPVYEQSAPPLLAPHQVDRARNLMNVFDDDGDDSVQDVKPMMSALQKALAAPPIEPTSSGYNQTMPNLKREVIDEEQEKEKLVLKIPKTIKSTSAESPRTRVKEERKDDRRDERKDRERDKDREKDRDGDRDRDREREKEEKAQKEKEKKERERERRRQRDRERAEQKRAEKAEAAGKKDDPSTSSSSSSKKRKLDKKDEKDRREPEKKKGKTDFKTTNSVLPTNSLKSFRIPKKETAVEDKKETKEDGPSTSTSGPSVTLSDSVRKESTSTSVPPVSRKESTVSSVPPPLTQRKDSFSSLSGPFPPSDHHREPPIKKKPLPPPTGMPPGLYPGPSNMGPSMSGSRGGNNGSRKPMPPPPPSMMRGPPPEQMYRERPGSMRGFPPSSHYHGGGSSSKQVASYAQGIPPGMGPPIPKSHGSNYQASQWVRPPTHRDSHSYHGMPSLGPPQIQRDPPPPPPPQMIPLPKDPPVLRENPPRERERTHRTEEEGPDSPEESTLRIDEE